MDKAVVRSLMNDLMILIKINMPSIQELRYEIKYKADGSPVTLADKMIEDIVQDFLKKRIPDLRFIGEETFDFIWKEDAGYLAILDPIDGTENFCSGLKEWGLAFSLWQGKNHLGSLLFMPELNEYLMTGDKVRKVTSRITGFSSSFTEEIAIGIRSAGEYRVTGCAVYNIFNIIRGSFTRFINPKGAYVWDLLPGLMLALEHGCKVVLDDKIYDGQLLDPTRKYRVDIRN